MVAVPITLALSAIGAIATARRTLTSLALVAGSAFAAIHALCVVCLAHGIHTACVLRPAQDNWINWYRLVAFDAPELFLIAHLPFRSADWRLDFWTIAGLLGIVGTVHQFMAGAGLVGVIQSGFRLKQNNAGNGAFGRALQHGASQNGQWHSERK